MNKIIINAIPLEAFQLLIKEVFHVLILSDEFIVLVSEFLFRVFDDLRGVGYLLEDLGGG